MKKSVVLLLIVTMFLSSIANAEININPLAKKDYNRGDTLYIYGSFSSAEAKTSTFKLFLSCGSENLQIQTKNYDLEPSLDYSFSQNVTLPFSMSGTCNVVATLGQEQAKTENFEVVSDLKGTFTLTPIQVQSGDSFELFGTVTKANSQKVDGQAIISLEKDGETFLTSNVIITNGKIDIKEKISDVPEGSYHINVDVSDVSGNKETFANAATLNVYTTLKITASTDKIKYDPKEIVTVTGDVKKTIGAILEEGIITIGYDGNEYDTDIVAGKFKMQLPLSSSVPSGDQQIDITVKDDSGNQGKKSIKFSVTPKESRLDASLDKEVYFPKEILSITPNLYDQANDQIDKKITLTIIDSKNNKVIEKSVDTSKTYEFKLDPATLPGTYKIKLSSSDLDSELSFNVEEVQDVDIKLDGQSLVVTNIGNTKYTQNIIVEAINDKQESKLISIRTKLDPKEVLTFDLTKELKQGNYDEIRIKDRDQTFFNVDLKDDRTLPQKFGDFLGQATGAVVGATGTTSNNAPLIYSLVAIILLLGIIIFIRMRSRQRQQSYRQREIKEGQKARKFIQETVVPQRKTYGKANEHDVKDFKTRMLSDIKNQQKDITRKEDWGTSNPSDNRGSNVRQSIERKIIFDRDNNQGNKSSQSSSFDRPKERKFAPNRYPKDKEEESSNSGWGMFN